MRVLLVKFFASIVLLLSFSSLQAQNSKVAYVDFEAIYELLPEKQQLKQQLEADEQKLLKSLESKQQVAKQKTDAFYASYPKSTSSSGQDSESTPAPAPGPAANQKALYEEARQAEAQVQTEYKNGKEAIAQKEKQQNAAISQKIRLAVEAVALEKGFSSVLPLSSALYCAATDNLTEAVMQKLGVKAKK